MMSSGIRLSRGLFAAMALLAALAACPRATAAGERATGAKVREPAVAGIFYPKDPAELSQTIQDCLAAARIQPVGDLKALICPHAGYEFSGPVAAYACKLLAGRSFDTVVVMGPSHYAYLHSASLPDAGLVDPVLAPAADR